MMAKVLISLAVLAGGALWIFGWPGSDPAQAGGRAVVLDPASLQGSPGGPAADEDEASPASAEGAAPGEHRPGSPRRRGGSPASPGHAAPDPAPDAGGDLVGAESPAEGSAALKASRDAHPTAAERAARVSALLSRAAGLEAAGDAEAAEKVLRDGMAASSSPAEVARLGFFLAGLSNSPAESRRLLSNALRRGVVAGDEYELASDLLRELNRSTGSSLIALLDVKEYIVQPNDSLWELCNRTFPREYGVSPEVGLIQLVNDMSGTALRVGQRLAVPVETLTLEVDRADHGIVAYLGDVALVAYRVGLGKEGRTPSGSFVVEVKLTEPTWYRDGRAIPFGNPENILGTRWMGFENNPGAMGYGIHGTAHPESIGSDESMGCVRMRNEEVEELFELVARGTTVNIP